MSESTPTVKPLKEFRDGPTHKAYAYPEAYDAVVRAVRQRGDKPLVRFAPKRERPRPSSWRFYPTGTKPDPEDPRNEAKAATFERMKGQAISIEMARALAFQGFRLPR